MKHLLPVILLLSALALAQAPAPASPQAYVNSTYAPPVGGRTWSAHNSTDFKNAITSSMPGDLIVLDAGVTYVGNFTLPAKSNPGKKWIYVVSSALATLPSPGIRVAPKTDAVKMPKVVTPNTSFAISIAPGGNHYRLVGLEITSASTTGCTSSQNCYSQYLVYGASVPGQPLADSVVVDRCYIHGSPTQDVREGVVVDGSNFAVVDSYISDIHQSTNDSQAVLGYYATGPIKVTNNYLESTGENIMFGGAGGYSNPWVPSDIEIRNNYFFKPLSWAKSGPGGTIPPGNQWAVKNLLELKSARRVIIDNNVFENVWVSAQTGFAVMLTPRTHDTSMYAVVDDVMISNNTFRNVSSGFDVAETDSSCLPANGCTNAGELKRVTFYNNLFLLGDMTQTGYTNGYGWGGLILPNVTDFVVQHNTFVPPPNLGYCKASVYFDISSTGPVSSGVSRTQNVWITDNVMCRQGYGSAGMIGQLPYSFSDYMGSPAPPDNRFRGNVLYAPTGDKVYPQPVHNYVSTLPLVYLNPSAGNYQLLSPNWTDTTDGKVAGYHSVIPQRLTFSSAVR